MSGTTNGAAGHDSFSSMLEAVQAFHDKHRFNEGGGEDLPYRVALMVEELGEMSACITKGRGADCLSEECADLLILLLGTAISADFDLCNAFWKKMDALGKREGRIVDGRVRVSKFDNGKSNK